MSRKKLKHELTPSQREVAQIIATNDVHKLTVDQISERVGVSRRTIYRWKQDRAFIEYQNECAENAMEDMVAEAYATLRKLLREGTSEKTQLEAIKLLLQNRGKLKEQPEITVNVNEYRDPQERERKIIEMERELLGEFIDVDEESAD